MIDGRKLATGPLRAACGHPDWRPGIVLDAFIGLAVFLQGLLCVVLAEDLVRPSRLAGGLLVGMAAFWGIRLWVQFFVYKPELWRGKRFETAVQVLFGFLWAYFALTFGFGAWRQLFG